MAERISGIHVLVFDKFIYMLRKVKERRKMLLVNVMYSDEFLTVVFYWFYAHLFMFTRMSGSDMFVIQFFVGF